MSSCRILFKICSYPFWVSHVSSYSLKKIEVLVREPLAPMVFWETSARVFVTGTVGRPLLISGLCMMARKLSGSGRAGTTSEVAGALGAATSGALLLLKIGCGGLGGPTLILLASGKVTSGRVMMG